MMTMTAAMKQGLVGLSVMLATVVANGGTLAEYLASHYDPTITFNEGSYRESSSHCRLGAAFVTGRDPVTNASRVIALKQFRAALPVQDENRAVILMPPTGGENILDQKWANQLCSRGIRVVMVESFETTPEVGLDLGMYDKQALRSLVAIRQTAEFLNQSGSNSIGILGTSLGALQASFATVIDSRINTAVFIAGGMGLAQIVARSAEPEQARLREMRMKAWKLDQAGYDAAVAKAIHVDVLPFVEPTLKTRKKVLSVVALNDSYVPTETQMRLYNAFGKQGVITFDREHVNSIARTSIFDSLTIVNFLVRNLPK